MQELLLKDLPDLSQARRYSRRASLYGASSSNAARKAGNVVWRGSMGQSTESCCLDNDRLRDSPRVVVEGLSATWTEARLL